MIPPINPSEKSPFSPGQYPRKQEQESLPQKQAKTFEQTLERQKGARKEISPEELKRHEAFLMEKMKVMGEQTRAQMQEVREKLEKLP